MMTSKIGSWRGVPGKERDGLIDSLRGLAIIAALFIGIFHLGSPKLVQIYSGLYSPDVKHDSVLFWLAFLVEEKFMTLLCLLIGWGLIKIAEGEKRRGHSPFITLGRRQAALLGLGMIHGLFIWSGDSLLFYGILGFAALPFIQVRARWLLVAAIFFLALLPALSLGSRVIHQGMTRMQNLVTVEGDDDDADESITWTHLYRNFDDDVPQRDLKLSLADFKNGISLKKLGVLFSVPYRRGPLWLVFLARPLEFFFLTLLTLYYEGFYYLGMILLGMWAARTGFFKRIRDGGREVWTLALVLLGTGVILSALTTLPYYDGGEPLVAMGDLATIFAFPAIFILGCAYLFFFAGLYSIFRWMGIFLAPLGRLSLSAYLMQSILCTMIFYPYGFRLYGKLFPGQLLLVALEIILLQIALAFVWVRLFTTGPAEALLRWFTYAEPRGSQKETPLPPPLPKVVGDYKFPKCIS